MKSVVRIALSPAAALTLLAAHSSAHATVPIYVPVQPITDPSALLPPAFAQNERLAKEKPALARLCEGTLRARLAKHRFSFDRPVFTRAEKWGDIVRIDYRDGIAPARPHRIDRVVCFQRPGPINFNIGYYENVPDDPKQRVWFSGVVLRLDTPPRRP